ncbi:MAG: class I SAM-dependent methyltransferase [Actinomycetota bacterium]|nr:class I SAM-dependent methyltransferase [Actinomycetota bacterium]
MTGVSRAEVEAARDDPKLANVLYHDWESQTYDEKWSISYDERCISYAEERFATIAGRDGWPYPHALELGCGTGFFLLNLMQAGVIERGSVSDISPRMVAAALRNAEGLGLRVDGRVADAELIPYDDDTFDLVVGHAFLHHLPDVEQSLRETLRVLKPGGRFVFAGEPTKWGDRVARRLGQATWWTWTRVTRLPPLREWRRPQAELDESSAAAALESVVDQHTFAPNDLRRMALAAGAVDVAVKTEELTAAWFGWPVRTFEAAVPKGKLGLRWANFAYRSWLRLSAVDSRILSRFVPEALFYNALVTGVKPHPPARLTGSGG